MPRVNGLIRELAQRPSVDGLAAHEHVQHRRRHVEQRRVVDLGHHALDLLRPAPAAGPEIDTTSPGSSTVSASASRIRFTAADALDEDTQAREKLAHRPACQAARRIDAVGAHLDLRDRRRRRPRSRAAPRHRPSAFRTSAQAAGRSTPSSFGPSLRQHDRGADRCRRCKSRRSRSGLRLAYALACSAGSPSRIDLVRRHADRGRDRLQPEYRPTA